MFVLRGDRPTFAPPGPADLDLSSLIYDQGQQKFTNPLSDRVLDEEKKLLISRVPRAGYDRRPAKPPGPDIVGVDDEVLQKE